MKQTKQNDLFDQAGAIQSGSRQIDLEQIIEEKENANSKPHTKEK
jgi:hypothetical protein